jgi:hypothetical protein
LGGCGGSAYTPPKSGHVAGTQCTAYNPTTGQPNPGCYVASCTDGFWAPDCKADIDCGTGARCVAFPSYAFGALGTAHLCLKTCSTDADCGRPGVLACDQAYDACVDFQGELLSALGTLGGHATSGGACSTSSPPARSSAFAASVLSSDAASTQSAEESVVLDPNGSALYIAYNSPFTNAGSEVARSADGGQTWTTLPIADCLNIGDPALAIDPTNGTVYYSYIAGYGTCQAGNSFYGGNEIHSVHAPRGGSSFSTWSLVNQGAYATQPQLFMDKSQGIVAPDGTYYVSFDAAPVGIATTAPSDIVVAHSTDGGVTFTDVRASDTTRQAGRDLAQLAADNAGDLWVSWQEPTVVGGIPPTRVGHIRVAKSTDHGMTFSPSVDVVPDGTAVAWPHALLASPDGKALYVVYQHQVGAPTNLDVFDVYAAVSTDGGATFGAPVKVNDDTSCATHWLPNVALGPSGHPWVIWYDNRFGDERVMGAEGMLGTGGALTFGANFLVSDHATVPFYTGRTGPTITDYLGFASLPSGLGLAAWAEPQPGGPTGLMAEVFTSVTTLPR